MSNYIYTLYDPNTKQFGTGGKLVFQKRKNGLFYDLETNAPLDPQPQKKDVISEYKEFCNRNLLTENMASASHYAEMYLNKKTRANSKRIEKLYSYINSLKC